MVHSRSSSRRVPDPLTAGLILDGLDSVFLNGLHYDEGLASLVQAAYDLNQKFRERVSCGSIVLLLRNDVFARIALSLPDSQKMRDDLSFDLDWRVLSGDADVRAPLMRLVNAKAARALGTSAVEVLAYFPTEIHVGKRTQPKGIPTFQYLLNMTRHATRPIAHLRRNSEGGGRGRIRAERRRAQR